MKKIGKILSAITVITSMGVILSMGRDFWLSKSGRGVGEYCGPESQQFGRHPAYAMSRNLAGKLIFKDAGQALRRFREDYPNEGKTLRETYRLPKLRTDTWELYQAYQEWDSQGKPADSKLAAFLEIYQNSAAN